MNEKNEQTKRFEQLGTKISPEYAEVLNTICDSLGVDVYHILQWFAYTLVRSASPNHELTPEMQKIMALLDVDAGWQTAFNLCAPDRKRVAQVILILEQDDHKGFGATMIDRPFMGSAQMTECVDDILERVVEVTMHGIYRRLRLLGGQMECEQLSDVLLTMIERMNLQLADERDMAEGPQMGDTNECGRVIAYGKKTKRMQNRNPDSLARDGRYHTQQLFTDVAGIEPPDAPQPEPWEGERSE